MRSPGDPTLLDQISSRHDEYAIPFMDGIQRWIARVGQKLEASEQLRVTALLPDGSEVLVESLGAQDPSLLIIVGHHLKTDRPCWRLAHQLAVPLLCEVEPIPPNATRREIGFRSAPEASGAEAPGSPGGPAEP